MLLIDLFSIFAAYHDPPEQSRMLLLHGVDLDLAKTCIDPIKGFGTTMKVALVFKAV